MSNLPAEFFGFGLDYNLRDHKKRSEFILACQEIEDFDEDPDLIDFEPKFKVAKLILKHAERLKIKLNHKDDQGNSGFDYLPEDWIEYFRTKYTQHFQF